MVAPDARRERIASENTRTRRDLRRENAPGACKRRAYEEMIPGLASADRISRIDIPKNLDRVRLEAEGRFSRDKTVVQKARAPAAPGRPAEGRTSTYVVRRRRRRRLSRRGAEFQARGNRGSTRRSSRRASRAESREPDVTSRSVSIISTAVVTMTATPVVRLPSWPGSRAQREAAASPIAGGNCISVHSSNSRDRSIDTRTSRCRPPARTPNLARARARAHEITCAHARGRAHECTGTVLAYVRRFSERY